jgi:hypothetical protein
MWHVWGKERHIQGLGGLGERDHLKGLGVDERTRVKWIFRKWDGDID